MYKALVFLVLILLPLEVYEGSVSLNLTNEINKEKRIVLEKVYEVGSRTDSEGETFGLYQYAAIAKDSTLYISEVDSREVRIFDKDGGFVKSIKSEGYEAGEFKSIRSMKLSPDGNLLYIYDNVRKRIITFSTKDYGFVEEYHNVYFDNVSIQMNILSSGNIAYTGYSESNDGIVHVTDIDGRHILSFGDLIKIDNPQYDTPHIYPQLSLSYLSETHGDDLIVSLIAPYRIAKYSPVGFKRWVIEEDILPDPTEGIEYSEERYSVSLYPQIVSLFALSEKEFIVEYHDKENEVGGYDIRSVESGELLGRHEISVFEYFYDFTAFRSGSEGLCVVKEVRDYPKFVVYKWKLEDI